MAWLLALLGPAGDFIAKLLKALGPPAVVVEAEKVGTTEEALHQEQNTNVEITKGAAAGDAADKLVSDPRRLSDFEAHDPNNRDNDSKA